MAEVYRCGCDCCIHYDNGECTCGKLEIDFDLRACGFVPICMSFEEEE